MQVVSVTELPEGREAKVDQIWKRTYKRVFYVVTDDKKVGPKTVLESLPVATGQAYDTGTERDPGAFCSSLSVAHRDDDGKGWLCVAEFGPYDATQWARDPLERQPQISWEYRETQEPLNEDIEGNPIVNSAGDPFDPPLLQDFLQPILKLTRNEANFDPALAYIYRGKVNATTFFGADPGYVKVGPITPQRVFNQDIGWYWTVSYEFIFNEKTWTTRVYNVGYRHLDPDDDTKKIEITDRYGQKISSPWPLDEDGQPLPQGSDPVILEFETAEKIDFSVFGFDDFFEALQSYQPPGPAPEGS